MVKRSYIYESTARKLSDDDSSVGVNSYSSAFVMFNSNEFERFITISFRRGSQAQQHSRVIDTTNLNADFRLLLRWTTTHLRWMKFLKYFRD